MLTIEAPREILEVSLLSFKAGRKFIVFEKVTFDEDFITLSEVDLCSKLEWRVVPIKQELFSFTLAFMLSENVIMYANRIMYAEYANC